MTDFPFVFGAALVLNLAVTLRSSDCWKKYLTSSSDSEDAVDDTKQDLELKKTWRGVLNRYLAVYLLATLSDWLQGAYVYALYDDYGYSQHDIAVLFVAGFGSSMIFGTFVGGMADKGGRRTFVLLYCLVYGASCITKHFKSFEMLMMGRLLGGIAYSLLFSIFEAWLIGAHTENGIKKYLSKSFTLAAYANSVVAIIAGLVGHHAASASKMVPILHKETLYVGGYISPFDISMGALVLCGVLALLLWEENFGDNNNSNNLHDHTAWHEGWKNACVATFRSPDILLCGVVSSLFEGSMYIFVFFWTPAITKAASVAGQEDDAAAVPLGLVFSTFMICCMAGSSLFSILVAAGHKCERIAVGVLAVACVSMALTAMYSSRVSTSSNDTTTHLLWTMNLFEMTIGLYFPCIATLKSVIVPDAHRVAIYNLFRIPLNAIVLMSLLTKWTPTQSFHLCTGMLLTATILQWILLKRRERHGSLVAGGAGKPTDDAEDIAPELELEREDSWSV